MWYHLNTDQKTYSGSEAEKNERIERKVMDSVSILARQEMWKRKKEHMK